MENLVTKTINFADCCVYGVKVPGNEGRAGMMALALHDCNTDGGEGKLVANGNIANIETREIEVLKDVADVFAKQLPSYARPVFVRFMRALDTTGRFYLFLCAYSCM